MSFPMYPISNQPMGLNAPMDSFQSNLFASVPGAFPPPMPIAMSVPGLMPPMDPFAPAMPYDPFGMPPMIDPMSGMPGDPMFSSNPFGIPPMVDPMSGMSMDPFGIPPRVDPITGMSMDSFGMPPMVDPMSGMPLDPFGMPSMIDPMTGLPISMVTPPVAFPPEMPVVPDSPLKQMMKNLLKMQLFKKLFNPGDPTSLDEQPTLGNVTVSDNVTALDIISDADNFDELSGGDGSVSYLDLSRAARKSGNAEVKSAASYIMNTNPHLFDQLESIKKPGDGIFTEKDLGKALRNKSIIQGKAGQESSEKIVDNISALDQLASKFSELEKAGVGPKGKTNGRLTFVELSRAARNEEDPTVKELAQYLMKSGLFSQLEELDAQEGVSLKDINAAYQDEGIITGQGPQEVVINTAGMTEPQALQILNSNMSKFDRLEDPKNSKRSGKSNSRISVDDLDAAINSHDKSITMDMKKAAQFMKDKGTLAKLDASESNANSDGAAAFETIRKWAADYDTQGRKANGPKSFQDAMNILNSNIQVFTNGDANKKTISYTELMQGLVSTDPKYTPEVKGMLQYLKDHKSEFDDLDKYDSSDNTPDGTIMVEVIGQSAVNGSAIDFGFKVDSPTTDHNRRAVQFIKDNFAKLEDEGSPSDDKEFIEKRNFQAALGDTSGKYTAEQKAMIKYVLNARQSGGKTIYESLGGEDGKISDDDVDDALTTDLSPGYISSNFIGDDD